MNLAHDQSRKRLEKKASPRPLSRTTLSPASVDAIGRFVRILARCGGKPLDIAQAVRRAAVEIPTSWTTRASRITPEMEYAPHMLTRWFSEAAYLDPFGKPRPLPFEGASGSVAALVRGVDSRFDPRAVLAYLIRGGAIRRQGRRYVPRFRGLVIQGARGPDYFHALQMITLHNLTNMLAALEHNLLVKPPARWWFTRLTENRQFPVREREALDKYVARLGRDMIYRLDAYMLRREVSRRPGEPTMRVGVGVHRWEEDQRTNLKGSGRRASTSAPRKRTISRRGRV
jgi:Family of unknown function (DUF6502)